MNKPLITIAITACNDERHLAKAIDSAIAQEGIDREIIVVDDGSTDNTDKVLDRYTDRIEIIRHKTNRGAVMARRTVLNNAHGEWITMIDGDDWLSPHALERALWASREADIVQMRINLRLESFPWLPIHWKQRYDSDHAVEAVMFNEHTFPVQAWGKLYRPEMLDSGVDTIDYDGFWGEDRLLNLPIMLRRPHIVVAHNAHYNYRLGGRSCVNRIGRKTEEIREKRLALLEEVKRVNQIKRDYLRSRFLLTKDIEHKLDLELERHTRYLTR